MIRRKVIFVERYYLKEEEHKKPLLTTKVK